MSNDDLIESIAMIGRQLSKGGVSELAFVVVAAGSPANLVVRADGLPTPIQQKRAVQLAHVWEGASFGAEAVAVGLRAAQEAARIERESEVVELTWTGPKPIKPAVARNDEALFEVIGSAESRLIVVSYATFKVPELVAKLDEAVDRGVVVDLVLEFHGSDPDEQQWWDPVQGLGATLPTEVSVWQWPIELRPVKDGKVGYLHVKCAVADGRHAFVSSANLTVYAMERNMELGVVVHGGDVPRRIADHFEALMDDGTLQRVETT